MLRNLTKRAVKAEQQSHDDITLVVDGLRSKELLGCVGVQQAEGSCSREQLGEELYDRLHRVCARTTFFGSFDHETLVCLPLTPPCPNRAERTECSEALRI
jgi:hypothetical protein